MRQIFLRQSRLVISFAACLCALGFVLASIGTAYATDRLPVYRVAKFEIWAQAKNAVEAKKIALQDGRREAFRYLYQRITPLNMLPKMPKLDDRELNRLVMSISIGKEHNSLTQYLATVDYQFDPEAVAALLQRKSIRFVDHQSPRIIILPLIDPSLANYFQDQDLEAIRKEWNLSFMSLDKHNGLVPIRVLKSSTKIDTEVSRSIIAGDAQTFKNLLRTYKSETLLLVHLAAGPTKNEVRLLIDGLDAVGSLSLRKNFPRKQRKLGALFDDLSDYAHGVVTARWKLYQSKNPGKNGVLTTGTTKGVNGFQTSILEKDGTKIDQAEVITPPVTNVKNVKFHVQFSGLREWTAIRRNLKTIRGVGTISISSLSARAAQISVAYQGKKHQFLKALPAHRLSAFRQGGTWVLMSQ